MELIERIRRQAAQRAAHGLGGVAVGIGDDCAVLRGSAGEDLLVTTDQTIENIHFRRAWHPAESVGHRALARGLSDIAAMGGEPVTAFLSLALPARTQQGWVDGFLGGFLRLARRYNVALAGGDVAESPAGIMTGVMVLGRVPRGKALLRSGAKPGDQIYVTGDPGAAARILRQLYAGKKVNPQATANRAHFFPEPRIEVGRWLRGRGDASAMIDLSDGISTDLLHICEESAVSAVVDEKLLPGHGASGWQREDMLHGGESYELLFTTPERTRLPARIAGVKITRIGEIVRRDGQKYRMMLVNAAGHSVKLEPRGWQHFKRNKH